MFSHILNKYVFRYAVYKNVIRYAVYRTVQGWCPGLDT